MPSLAVVINRANSGVPVYWYTATVTAVTGRNVTATLDNSAAYIGAIALDPAPIVGARVLLVSTGTGNYVLGTIG